jgi:hypothetical protein
MLTIHLPEVYPPPLDHAKIDRERREKADRKAKRREQIQQFEETKLSRKEEE